MILELAYIGNPILRQQAKSIEVIDDSIRALVADMIETMDYYNGVGIAAPQVKQSLRLFVTRASEELDEENKEEIPVQVFINPRLYDPSEKKSIMDEGCLSIPGLSGPVMRPEEIWIEATDLDGNKFVKHMKGFCARVVMHENDHLNGVLYYDRMHKIVSKNETQVFMKKLKLLEKKYST